LIKEKHMEKIEIVQVSERLFTQKGFKEKGCYSSICMDACCRQGCDVDKETYDLILEHREDIERMLGRSLEQCFVQEWSGEADFLGKNSIASTIINGTCPFHTIYGKGCVLWQMVLHDGCPRRMIPSTCRLYPVTWHNGVLDIVQNIEKDCSCLNQSDCGARNLWTSQLEAIEDIFQLKM